MSTNTTPKLYALLIGIDRYSQVPLPDGSYYPHLGGCVRDINNVEQMLKKRLELPDSQITKLLSVRTFDDETDEFGEDSPTYENLVAAFKKITADAQNGDQLYIHYSGHGGRCATMFPEIKGENGLDESLVPCDIGENGACYLRDIELAYLLRAMDEKGISVTLILDSCHSGGATRGRENGSGGAVPRGINSIDMRPPPETSAVAGKEILIKQIQNAPLPAQRSFQTNAGWNLTMPEKCVFLAACRANELANEYPFDGKQNNGALTYWMLDALNQLDGESTFQMLYNRVVAKVHAKFADQTPQIEGDRNRKIFGGLHSQTAASVNVIEIANDGKRIKLNTGFHQGIVKGAQFAVFDETVTDFSDISARLAVVEIETVEDSGAWAQVVGGDRSDEIKEGSQAVLLGIPIRLRGRIRFDKQGKNDQALDKLANEIAQTDGATDSEKWVRLAEEGEQYDFQVAVNRYDEFEIRDVSGQLLNIRPLIKTSDEDSVNIILRRLVHLTKFRNVQLIDNTDPTSPLANKLSVEFGLVEEVEKDGKTLKKFIALEMPARPLSVGEKCGLRITNKSDKNLSLVIMDLAPDHEISQMYPENADYDLLEAGKTVTYDSMETALPDTYQQGAEIFKIFATVEGTSFRWLELPPLDNPAASATRSSQTPKNALEELMSSFAAPAVRKMKKTVNLSSSEGVGWATASIEIQIRRPTIAHVADPALSLLQSAFDQTIANDATQKTRSVGKISDALTRPELDNPYIKTIAQYSLAAARNQLTPEELAEENKDSLDEAQKRGIVDTAKYCASMAVGMAKNLWDAKVKGNTELYDQYHAALTQRMGGCDPSYKAAITQFLKFLKDDGVVPYQRWVNPDDFIIEGRLDANAVVGIVADWGTGEPEALEVLRQVKENHQPQVAIHLGDIYYAGTEYEVENYFYQPWKRILDIPNSNILSMAVAGNHDMYAGGKPFYNLLNKLKIDNKINSTPASYFCLRNEHWQLIGLDTALHDRLIGGPTYLEDSEVEWLKHKFDTANGRRTILLSHHQLFSANDSFDGKSYNEKLYDQVKDFLPQTALWLWGHEHDQVIFDPFMNLERGRCIGGSAFPVGNFEMPLTVKNADVPFNKNVSLSKGKAFYHHCYTILKLNGKQATVYYYEDRDGGKLLFEETI